MTPLVTGLHLPECPRWRDGYLWYSDMWDHKVWRTRLDGTPELVHDFGPDEDPGGLGWLPDGRLLVSGMEGRRIYVVGDDGVPIVHADVSAHAPAQINDMVVAADGTAYVSQFGYDMWHGGTFTPAVLIRVRPDGSVDAVADDLLSPNGMALTPDGGTLIVAESGGFRLTAFEVGAEGTLGERSLFAQLVPPEGSPYAPPDGICLDAEGAVWLADPINHRVQRVGEGGEVLQQLDFDRAALAVNLVGDDLSTLAVCLTSEHHKPTRSGVATGGIETVRVDVPGTGSP